MVDRFRYLVVIIAALAMACSFEPVGIWFLAPIAYALLLTLLRNQRDAISLVFIFGFLSNLIILSWTKTFVGVLPWIMLTLLQALLLLPVGIVAKFQRNLPLSIFLLLALEELKSRFPFGGFSWTRVAFSQIESPLAPLISIFGVVGLSAATLFLSYCFINLRRRNILVLALLLISSLFIISPESQDSSLKVRAIQGGVPARGLDFNARAEEVLDRHIDATLKNFQSDDGLIIWPENAIDIDPFANSSVSLKLNKLQSVTRIPLIAGAIIDDGKLRNASILFNNEGESESIYIKRYLTPFGEYIPLRFIADKLSPHVDRVSDFSPGDVLVTHQVNGISISSVICYEILNDGLIREAAKNSQLMVIQTNSATFSGSAEGMQQMAITRLRAIESGRSIVTVSTTGPSAFIDKGGEVLQLLEDGEVGSIAGNPSIERSQTLSVRFGGFATLFVLFSALIWAYAARRRKGKKV